MLSVPSWTSPTFAEDIRRHTVHEYDVDELIAGTHDTSNDADVRFSCLYAALQLLHRQDRDIEYGRLVDEHEEEFGDNPYFHTFRAT